MSIRSRMKTWLSTPSPGGPHLARVVRFVVPNSLSLLRVVLALAFPWVPACWRAGWIIAAALSDLFDGSLSRAMHGISTLGQILDPVADKLFVGIVLFTLVLEREVTLVELLLLGFRDVAVLSGSAWSVIRRGWGALRHMPPSVLGKLATAGQFGFLLLLTLGLDHSTSLFRLIEAAAVISSLLAGMDYLWRKGLTTDHHETA